MSEGQLSEIVCSKCGELLYEGDVFCGNCGKKVPHCENCGAIIAEKAKFCIKCGSSAVKKCGKCGAVQPEGAEFCLECGAKLAHDESSKAAALESESGSIDSVSVSASVASAPAPPVKAPAPSARSVPALSHLQPASSVAVISPQSSGFWNKAKIVLLIFIVGIAIVFLLGTFVLPTYVAYCEGMNLPLPLLVRILIGITKMVRDPVFVFVLVAIVYGVFLHKSHS